MSAQVITGIGFYRRGVLVKENFDVKGMKTGCRYMDVSSNWNCICSSRVLIGLVLTIFTFLILKIEKVPVEYFKNNNENEINN
jgi:uncharacterized membrane protein YhiD involved in acid resistance